MKYNLSVIIPTITPEKLLAIYDQLISSVGSPYTFELICSGPDIPPEELRRKSNFKFFVDKGSPARCYQLATFFAEGEYIALIPDDCILMKNSFSECLQLVYQNTAKDGIILRYSEGVGYKGGDNDLIPEYWTARYHGDQQLPGVLPEWKIAPSFMYNLSYFRELGGLDCRFEHVNMNTHDFAFRLQKTGGQMLMSPSKVMACDWNPDFSRSILFRAYIENDQPLFSQLYAQYDPNRIKIDYSNWVQSPSVWPRRYGNS